MAPTADTANDPTPTRLRPRRRHQTAEVIPVDASTEIRVCTARNGKARLYIRRGRFYVYADLTNRLAARLSQALGYELQPEVFREAV